MFRNVDGSNDWIFGSGTSSYVTDDLEILLNVKTRVMSFLNDCFFAIDEGIDWWNLLEYNQQDRLENAVQQTIIQTPGVTEVIQINSYLTSNRQIKLEYSIKTDSGLIYTEEVNPNEV